MEFCPSLEEFMHLGMPERALETAIDTMIFEWIGQTTIVVT